MSESAIWKLGGALLIAWGLKLIIFGGTKITGGSHFEIMGFEFGTGEREPMSLLECWFVGLVLIGAGTFVEAQAFSIK